MWTESTINTFLRHGQQLSRSCIKPLLNQRRNQHNHILILWKRRTGVVLHGPDSSFTHKIHKIQHEASKASDDLGSEFTCCRWPPVFH